MYIRSDEDELVLVRTVKGPDGLQQEVILARLGQDAELNLFFAAETGRRKNPEPWEGVLDFHLLQALETYKRRLGNLKPALVVIQGNTAPTSAGQDSESES